MLLLNPLPQRLDSGATPTFAGLLAADGTAAAPSISFAADSDTGFYRAGANVFTATAGGLGVMNFSRSGGSNGGRLSGTVVGNEFNLFDLGGISLTAAGTNQNITLTPSGTGKVVIPGNSSILRLEAASDTNYRTEFFNSYDSGNPFSISTFGSTWLKLTSNGLLLSLSPTGAQKVLVGTLVDSGALLQIGTNTTNKTGGIAFGTDTFLYRVFAYQLNFGDATSNAMFNYDAAAAATCATIFKKAGTEIGRIGVAPSGTSLLLATGANVTALTLDSSQNATFAAQARGVGAAAAPAFSFTGATGGGLYRGGSGEVGIAVAGVSGLAVDTSLNSTFAGTVKPILATTAGAPAYVKGAIYFDTTLNKLRVGGATAWETITSV